MTILTPDQIDCHRRIGRDEEPAKVAWTEYDALLDSHEEMRETLDQINKLRNDAVGLQSCGISSFLYPLVAILGDAGIEGEGYDVARERINTIFTQRDEALTLLKLVWGHISHRRNPLNGEAGQARQLQERIEELIVQFDALKLQPELDKGEKELEKA